MSKIKLKRGDDESRLVQIKHTNDDDTLLPFDLTDTQRADLHAKANGQIVLQLSTQDGSIEWYTQASQQVGESRVTELINERLATITNGATTAFDTLKEVEDHLTKGNTATSAILEQIATIKQDITAIKEFIGIEQSSDLETTINNALTTGE